MSNDAAMVHELHAHIAQDIPGFSVESKSASKLMKVLAILVWPFNREFMARFYTTIYPRIYAPDGGVQDAARHWRTLAHEWVHLRAMKRFTPLFQGFLYLFPASLAALAVFSVLALGGNASWLANLLWLLCLAPLPAYFRMRDEWNAFRMTLAVEYWTTDGVANQTIDHITKHFVGPHYWYMWPFESRVRRNLYHEVAQIKKGVYDGLPPYVKVKGAIDRIWKPTSTA